MLFGPLAWLHEEIRGTQNLSEHQIASWTPNSPVILHHLMSAACQTQECPK